ncbi:hypothetical protein LTR78_003300 [Recurvomyces mirabilis]|uniref:Xylanolytic transcriptional activator regulatory domain-containing protein n=1 Tax=Recurvomyces mirabilis TaxID=574656 RepID=A0AAE0WT28_9PEZI|nr:hypothetical protein LTR78_003300 [Recurvomyces mirabilis]KAK5156884.1 hypothetical protein LTS14_004401 [Recurvomyces mirabilis]
MFTCTEEQRKDAVDYRPHARNQHARKRLSRLETLVTGLFKAQESHHDPTRRTSVDTELRSAFEANVTKSTLANSIGKLELTDNGAAYTGSSHWTTILEEIQDIKSELSEEYPSEISTPASSVQDAEYTQTFERVSLLNSAPYLAREDILSFIPARKVADRLVSHFFNVFDLGPFLIHRGTFFEEYTRFWIAPSNTPVMWLGLLFSMMGTSLLMQRRGGFRESTSELDPYEMLDSYRAMTAHCLSASEYLKPSKYTVETLILHFALDHNNSPDASTENWMLLGVIVRVAMRAGLHRDPSNWPNIKPLQAELRRRLWIMLYHMDFFTSTQTGLPRIIKDSQCDVRLPRHLLESDLNFQIHDLPPERRCNERTSLLGLIERHEIIAVGAAIYDAVESGSASPATEHELLLKLQTTISSLSDEARFHSFETSIAQDPMSLLNQICLDTLIQKDFYLLHRRSFKAEFTGQSAANKQCIDAALTILGHQRRLDEETAPGGIFYSIRWKVVSLLNQEFLQATMLLCLALQRAAKLQQSSLYRKNEIVQALVLAKPLFAKKSDRWTEARKAVDAINAVTLTEQPHTTETANGETSQCWSNWESWMDDSMQAPSLEALDFGRDVTLDIYLLGDDENWAMNAA